MVYSKDGSALGRVLIHAQMQIGADRGSLHPVDFVRPDREQQIAERERFLVCISV